MTQSNWDKKILHWYIQKPKAHNCPLRTCGAVFEEFEPTVHEMNCEWIKVVKDEDYQRLKAELESKNEQLKQNIKKLYRGDLLDEEIHLEIFGE